MKRRNWTLIALAIMGVVGFVLSRTVFGPPSRAVAADHGSAGVIATESFEHDQAERRYLNNEPRHWRYILIKRQ